MGVLRVSFGFPTVLPLCFYGISCIFLCGFPTYFPRVSYGCPTVFLRFHCVFLHGFPAVFPRFSYGFSEFFFVVSYGFPTGFLRVSCGFPTVFLRVSSRYFYGFPAGFLRFSYGFPTVFLRFYRRYNLWKCMCRVLQTVALREKIWKVILQLGNISSSPIRVSFCGFPAGFLRVSYGFFRHYY